MKKEEKIGVIAGCDRNQEWMLRWWWDNYSEHNAYPIAFADFGMSEEAAIWCKERGLYFKAPEIDRIKREIFSKERKLLWEKHYGEGIWFHRELCLRKPFALLASPFPFSLWLDLDCRVRANLSPLFEILEKGAEIGMRREPDSVQASHKSKGFLAENEINYNSGVIPYRKDAPILIEWIRQIRENSDAFIFDQHAFSRALTLENTALTELPDLYNWSPGDGSNPDALIYHFHGAFLKDPALLYFFQ